MNYLHKLRCFSRPNSAKLFIQHAPQATDEAQMASIEVLETMTKDRCVYTRDCHSQAPVGFICDVKV